MAWKLRKDKLKGDTPDSDAPEAETTGSEDTSQAIIAPPPPAVEGDASTTSNGGQPIFPSRPAPQPAEAAHEPQFSTDEPQFQEGPSFQDSPSFQEPPASSAEPRFDAGEADEPQFLSEPTQPSPIVLGGEPLAMGDQEPIELEPLETESGPTFADQTPIALGAQGPLSVGPSDQAVIVPEETAQPSAMGAFTPYEPSAPIAPPLMSDEHTLPEAEREIVITPPAPEPVVLEPEAITPPPPAEDAPLPAPNREAIASGLVTTDTESGLPRVAPFIVDTPPTEAPAPAGTPSGMHSVILRLGNLSATFFLVKDVTTIGRPDAAVENYPDIEIELDDGVSRRHAEIHRQGDAFSLVDVGSTNGTILNGEMLTPHQPAPLNSGDRVHVGERTEILFE